MDPTLIFSLGLLLAAAAMTYGHRQAWLAKQDSRDEQQLEFANRRFRRRTQTSAMLGVVAIAIFAARWIDLLRQDAPWVFMAYWMVVVLLVLWVALLAGADYIATRHYLSKIQRQQAIEAAQLRAEARRLASLGKQQTDKPDDC